MERSSRIHFGAPITLLLATAALALGEPVLMPLALAMLAAFALSPLVDVLERWRLGRVPAVVAVCILLGASVFGTGWVVAREVSELSVELPQYRTVLRDKIRDLRGPIGSITGAAEEITEFGDAIQQRGNDANAPKVEVVEKPRLLGMLSGMVVPVVGPLGTIGLVVVLALFMLLEREELRDRMIWLTGARDLSLTTHALDDAAQRVTRYIATQSLVNGIQGLAVGIGLFLIGVPGAVLWGALTAVLRFIPYFGAWTAAVVPILLSVAAFPGWNEAMLTLALLVGVELVSSNVLEPWLYGTSVGLSPFGIVFSAVFWAWLWGIPGLLLATPLTVCLVVAGRYVPSLRFFPVLLGDQPALPADVRFYQRLIALDLDEAEAVLRESGADASLEKLSDELVLPALRRLAADDQDDTLPDDKTDALRERLDELLLGLTSPVEPGTAAAGLRVLFVPALDDNDALASRWMASVAASHGASVELASSRSLISEIVEQIVKEKPDAICITALSPRGAPHARLLCKRIAEAGKSENVVWVGSWAAPAHEIAAARDLVGGCGVHLGRAEELTAALASLGARSTSRSGS